ncbi:MAG: bifunctional heptose 7-phosphate kinase/heptose 1-phosphate adenyltransferase [Acidobacteriota bacterium]
MIGRERLHHLVGAFPGRRILLYGDLVLDRFVLGSPKRISREAPVIILRFEEQRDIPGGGANALANIAALGGVAIPVGFVGDDEPGRSLLAVLQARGVETAGVTVLPGFRTVTKVRLLAGGPSSLKFQVARYDIEDTLPVSAGWHDAVARRLATATSSIEAAAVSDYGYGAVTPNGVALLRELLPAGALTLADSRYSLTTLGRIDGATPNLEELAQVTGDFPRSDTEVAAAAESLRRLLRARFVVATRGSQGLTLVEDGHEPFHLPVFGTDQVADVTGAGDTVLAALALSFAAGASAREAACLANIAGGIVVTKLGTATVSAGELHHAIDLATFLHA